jgi:hypothetical protein
MLTIGLAALAIDGLAALAIDGLAALPSGWPVDLFRHKPKPGREVAAFPEGVETVQLDNGLDRGSVCLSGNTQLPNLLQNGRF